MLKIAILGNSHEEHDSLNWYKAMNMAFNLASGGHQIIAAGSNGIASAVAAGVRQVQGVVEPGKFSHLRVLTDIGGSDNYFPSESNEDDYFSNLRKLVMGPDIWVFFNGRDGTAQQLTSILHMIRKGKLSLHYKWIVMMCPESNQLVSWGTHFLKMRDFRISMIMTYDIGRIDELTDDIEYRAIELINRVWGDFQEDGVMTHWDLQQQILAADPQMGHDLCDRMIIKAAKYGNIKVTDQEPTLSRLGIG